MWMCKVCIYYYYYPTIESNMTNAKLGNGRIMVNILVDSSLDLDDDAFGIRFGDALYGRIHRPEVTRTILGDHNSPGGSAGGCSERLARS